MTMPEGWRQEERGWFVHEQLGGVCRERDGAWWAYPLSSDEKRGPFNTARVAADSLAVQPASAGA